MSNSKNLQQPVFDARTLGKPKMFTLGLQHMFAMFGATVLVPAITGLPVSTTLLFAGIGTLLFHLITKFRVPAFLGSSFAFIGGYLAVVEMGGSFGLTATQSLPYACIGVASAGFLYFILAALFAAFGARKVMKFFPANVYGGLGALKALAGPFGGVKFIPTGGVSAANLAEFIKSPYIHAVGGSWVCPKAEISAHNFEKITALCREARETVDAARGE